MQARFNGSAWAAERIRSYGPCSPGHDPPDRRHKQCDNSRRGSVSGMVLPAQGKVEPNVELQVRARTRFVLFLFSLLCRCD